MITKCPHCEQIFDLDPEWETKKAKCDSCDEKFYIARYIECPSCTYITPKNEDICESCNSSIELKVMQESSHSPLKLVSQPPPTQSYQSQSNIYEHKRSRTNSRISDEAVLNSVSPLMRFWIRLCAVCVLLTTIIRFGDKVYEILSSRYGGFDIKKIIILVVITFLIIMAANMMSNSAKTKAKITYNMFHKVVVILFFIILLVDILFVIKTSESQAIKLVWFSGILTISPTYFISWKLYKERAVAQAEEIDS